MRENTIPVPGNTTGKTAALVTSTIASFLTPFMGSAVNIALPSIGREFRMDAIAFGWIATAYLLSAAIFLLPFGRIADIYGRKRIFIWGIIVFTGTSVLSALSTSAIMLISFRTLQGIGSAMIFGTAVAILTSVFPANERGKALGINTAAVYIGLSLGPVLGGMLTALLGWRSIFWANVPLGLFVITAVLWKLKDEWHGARGERFDFVGSAIYGLSLTGLMYGFSRLPGLSALWFITGGALGIFAFTRLEMKMECPVININLFRHNTIFTFSNLAALINYSATFAVGFLLSLYLQYTKSLTPEKAGMILVSQPIVMALLSPFAGRLSDKIEPRIVATSGMVVTFAGLVFFIFLNAGTSLPVIIAGLILLGIGFGLFSSPNTNAVMGSVEKRFYGVASATLGTMRLTGNMLSMGLVMLIFATYIGRVQITPEYYSLFLKSVRVAFTVFAIICFAGIFASLARGKVR